MAAKHIDGSARAGRAIASFLIPPVGIVTYFQIKADRPKKAKAYLGISVVSMALMVGYGIYYKVMWDKAKKEAGNN